MPSTETFRGSVFAMLRAMNPSAPFAPEPLLAPARQIVQQLRAAGHEAYIAGGAVRDWLLGRPQGDLDIATSARPDEVRAVFPRTVAVGESFGVLIVHLKGQSYEVATFRTESGYADGRHPEHVAFADARADVSRRDFTINGLFYDPIEQTVHDWVGGRADLAAGLIRTIGDPGERFTEDRLRLLRAARFAAQLGFAIEARTAAALHDLAPGIDLVSMERVRMEIEELLIAPGAAVGLALLLDSGLGQAVADTLAASSVSRREAALALTPFAEATRALASWLTLRASGPAGFPEAEWWLLLTGLLGLRPDEAPPAGLHRGLDRLWAAARFSRGEGRRLLAAGEALLALPVLDGGRLADQLRLLRHPGRDLLSRVLPVLRTDDAGDVLRRLVDLERAHAGRLFPPPLLSGDRLLELGVVPGPAVGRWLDAVESEQLEGRLATPADAEAWLRGELARHLDRS